MAHDRDSEHKEHGGGDDMHHQREIGEGMHSPDSTQMPLKAENAEPDWRTVKGGKPGSHADESNRESDRESDRDVDRDRQSNR
jgi:hypothetical protein